MDIGINEGNYPEWLTKAIAAAFTWGIEVLLCIKSYLLFFKHRYHESIQNETWNKDINLSSDDWFIKNKNKWGSFKYIIKFLIIPHMFLIVAAAVDELVLSM